eukprot:2218500-Rhodomonas_salina.2
MWVPQALMKESIVKSLRRRSQVAVQPSHSAVAFTARSGADIGVASHRSALPRSSSRPTAATSRL